MSNQPSPTCSTCGGPHNSGFAFVGCIRHLASQVQAHREEIDLACGEEPPSDVLAELRGRIIILENGIAPAASEPEKRDWLTGRREHDAASFFRPATKLEELLDAHHTGPRPPEEKLSDHLKLDGQDSYPPAPVRDASEWCGYCIHKPHNGMCGVKSAAGNCGCLAFVPPAAQPPVTEQQAREIVQRLEERVLGITQPSEAKADEHNGFRDPAHCDLCHAVAKASS